MIRPAANKEIKMGPEDIPEDREPPNELDYTRYERDAALARAEKAEAAAASLRELAVLALDCATTLVQDRAKAIETAPTDAELERLCVALFDAETRTEFEAALAPVLAAYRAASRRSQVIPADCRER
jgi:hypothetical protein